MRVLVAPGPGNGKEVMDALSRVNGLKAVIARDAEDLASADLIITPRGPSRSFSTWYRDDLLGRAVVEAHQNGTPWLALCGSALPLCASFGTGCKGVEPLSLAAMKGTNDMLQGQEDVAAGDGTEFPFHFTSAPTFHAEADTEVLGTTEGQGSILRAGDLVVASGLPLTEKGWGYLFDAAGCPVAGARIA